MGRFDQARVDRAAGGIVIHDGRVLVVHRPRYDDWSLPKGHLDAGETWAEAARREVLEETGVDGTIVGPPMPIAYTVTDLKSESAAGANIKIVVFYLMTCDEGSADGSKAIDVHEVDAAAWWPVDRALRELSYADERRLLAEAYP